MPPADELDKYFKKLRLYFGPPGKWWPGESRFEIMVSAVLTQHTNWKNVEAAMRNLKTFRLLSPEKLHELDEETIQEAIQPAGQFRQKARRLKTLVAWLMNRYGGDPERARKEPVPKLRAELLDLSGIGPETADTILLFAFDLPTFVVDAYTYRVLSRHQIVGEETSYEELQEVFHEGLPVDAKRYQEAHALIVEVGKKFCKPQPKCEECPLKVYLPSVR
jgi:endonuclease-3 related protein